MAGIFKLGRVGHLELRISGLLSSYRSGNGKQRLFFLQTQTLLLPIKISPLVTKCEAGREVVWEGKRLGIHAVHRFDFQEIGDRVVLTSTEKFGGPLFFLARLLFIPQQLHRLTKKLLSEIKQAAEACITRDDGSG